MTGIHFIDAIISVLLAICGLFTGFVDMGTAEATGNFELQSERQLLLFDAMYSGQGITTDGKSYYTSGSMTAVNMAGLAKWDADFNRLVTNDDAIPSKYRDMGNNHIGGISYYNGLIYASCEKTGRGNTQFVMTYDSTSLKFKDAFEVPSEYLPEGIPWLTVDGDNGFIYTSHFGKEVETENRLGPVERICAFKLEPAEDAEGNKKLVFDHYIELEYPITRIQGGEYIDGVIYLSIDNADSNDDDVLAVDVKTGDITVISTRSLPAMAGNEAEGLTVVKNKDGSLTFTILDYDKTVATYVRTYKYTE